MTNNELKNIVADCLKGNDRIIECTAPVKPEDTLRIITRDEDDFTIRVQPTDEAKKNNIRENFVPLILSIAVLGLFDLGIVNKKTASKYIKALGQNVDELDL